MWQAERYHDISCGHRVVGHEGKCRHLHGHNYRIHFTCQAEGLDDVGRVIDFSDMKSKLCMWVEEQWDHKFLAWNKDPILSWMHMMHYGQNVGSDLGKEEKQIRDDIAEAIVFVPFNPTAENMAKFLVEIVGPDQLKGTGIKLVAVRVEETRKCSASYFAR